MINVNDAEIIATESTYILEFFGVDELLVDYENNKVGVQVSALTELMVDYRNSTSQAVSDLRNAQLSYVHNYITKQVEKLDSPYIEIVGGASNLKVKYKGDVVFHFKISNRSSLSYIAIPGWELKPKTDVLDRIYDAIARVKDMISPSLEIEKGSTNDKEKETTVEYPENVNLFNTLKDEIPEPEPKEVPQPEVIRLILMAGEDVTDRYTLIDDIKDWLSSTPEKLMLDVPVYEYGEKHWYLNDDLVNIIFEILTIRNAGLRGRIQLKENVLELIIKDGLRLTYRLSISELLRRYKTIDVAVEEIHYYISCESRKKETELHIELIQDQNKQTLSDRRMDSIRNEGICVIRSEISKILDKAIIGKDDLEDVLIDIEELLPELLETVEVLMSKTKRSRGRRGNDSRRGDDRYRDYDYRGDRRI